MQNYARTFKYLLKSWFIIFAFWSEHLSFCLDQETNWTKRTSVLVCWGFFSKQRHGINCSLKLSTCAIPKSEGFVVGNNKLSFYVLLRQKQSPGNSFLNEYYKLVAIAGWTEISKEPVVMKKYTTGCFWKEYEWMNEWMGLVVSQLWKKILGNLPQSKYWFLAQFIYVFIFSVSVALNTWWLREYFLLVSLLFLICLLYFICLFWFCCCCFFLFCGGGGYRGFEVLNSLSFKIMLYKIKKYFKYINLIKNMPHFKNNRNLYYIWNLFAYMYQFEKYENMFSLIWINKYPLLCLNKIMMKASLYIY